MRQVGVRMAAAAAALTLMTGCGTSSHRTATVPTTTTVPVASLHPDAAATSSQLGGWRLVGHETTFGPSSDEGVATIGTQVIYRGDVDLTTDLAADGWNHIGDPDADGTSVVDAYQGPPGATAKMFMVTAPSGATYQLVHPLAPGEAANNSFVAVSPDRRWLVSGEWETEHRLLVFPADGQATTDLTLAGTVALDRPGYDIQGCDFVTSTRLLCVSDDPGTALWPTPFPLLQVDLAEPLRARQTTDAEVTDLGGLPLVSRCPGGFEPEGIDYDMTTGVLRVEVQSPMPCGEAMTVYDYRQG